MNSLNDLIWTDEKENEIMTLSLDNRPMAQICAVSVAQCMGEPGGNIDLREESVIYTSWMLC